VIGRIAFCLTFLLTAAAAAQTPNTGWYTANSAAAVFTISTADELAGLAQLVNGGNNFAGKTINLADGIDLSGYDNWKPIGNFLNPFRGKFDGGSFLVRALNINRPSESHIGLFGFIAEGAEVLRLGVSAEKVTGNFYVGVLAGLNNGTVKGCWTSGAVEALRQESNAGGLVGGNGGEIFISYSTAGVSGRDNVGGLVGLLTSNAGGMISDSYAAGSVSGAGKSVGGLVGYALGGKIGRSYSAADISGSANAGGFIGGGLDASNAGWTNITRTSAGEFVSGIDISEECFYIGSDGLNPLLIPGLGWFEEGGHWILADNYPRLKDVPLYTLSFNASGNGKLRVNGNLVNTSLYVMVVKRDSTVTVKAEPDAGYKFIQWSDGNTNQEREYNVLADAAVTAVFDAKEMHTLTFLTRGRGRVVEFGKDGDGLPRYTALTAAMLEESNYRVIAYPHNSTSKYTFRGWSDGWTGGRDRSGVVRGDTAVIAIFMECDPVYIYTFQELSDIRENLSGCYVLMNDIDMSGELDSEGFMPVGTAAEPFTGVFDGMGHTISGLRINNPSGRSRIGLFGSVNGGTIRDLNIKAGSVITGTAAADTAGGLAGFNDGGTITGCSFTGTVTASSVAGGIAGGLVGYNSGADATVERSYSSGTVTGGYAGGLAGFNNVGALITDSYSASAISTGVSAGGGLVGHNSGTITYCYSIGEVSGLGTTGGLAGSFGVDADVSGSYWNTQTSGKMESAGGDGKTTAEMKTEAAYPDWNFGSVWLMDDKNSGYPYLKWEYGVMFGDYPSPPLTPIQPQQPAMQPEESQLTEGYAAKHSAHQERVITASANKSELSNSLTAGPNPAVLRSAANAVRFYRTGSGISRGFLNVYNSGGSLVKRVKVTENLEAADRAPGVQGGYSKREIAQWDLTDAKGRTVPVGTYLIKGVITTTNGKRENVSFTFGVIR